MTIQTARLTLRHFEPGDADWIFRDITNPNVAKWLTALPWPYRRQDAESFVAQYMADPGYRVIVADQPIGVVSVAVRNGVPELGYWLAEPAWGRGYMSEAAKAMLTWTFEQGFKRSDSGWVLGNAGSENVLTKLGYVPTGEIKPTTCAFHPEPVPVKRVTLTSDVWQARQTA